MLRFDPFREFDRATDQIARQARSMLAMDAVRSEQEVIIYIDVPGVGTEDVDVTVEKNELSVTVRREWEDGDLDVITSERPQGTFTRRIMLSDALDLDHLKARLENGVLTVAIPVAERSKQRKIEVSTGGKTASIDTTASES